MFLAAGLCAVCVGVVADGAVKSSAASDSIYVDNKFTVLGGIESVFSKDDGGNLVFEAEVEFDKFDMVKVDDKVVEKANYTAKAGRTASSETGKTIVTLSGDYLKTLRVGEHMFRLESVSGWTEIKFYVISATEDSVVYEEPTIPDSKVPGHVTGATGKTNDVYIDNRLDVIAGYGSVYSKAEGISPVFEIEAETNKFDAVKIDDRVLTASEFTYKSGRTASSETGSTIITVKADTLNKLGKGYHILKLETVSGWQEVLFSVMD